MYTPYMRMAVQGLENEAGLNVEILEYGDSPSNAFLSLRFYASQWRKYTDKERAIATDYLVGLRNLLTDMGALVTLEPVEDE